MWLKRRDRGLSCFVVDLVAGWEAFEHSMWARSWRKEQPFAPLEVMQMQLRRTT